MFRPRSTVLLKRKAEADAAEVPKKKLRIVLENAITKQTQKANPTEENITLETSAASQPILKATEEAGDSERPWPRIGEAACIICGRAALESSSTCGTKCNELQKMLSAVSETAQSIHRIDSESKRNHSSRASLLWSMETEIDKHLVRDLVSFDPQPRVADGVYIPNQAAVVRRLGLQISTSARALAAKGIPYPIQSFDVLPLHNALEMNISHMKLRSPTPIQRQIISLILKGIAVHAIGPTKSGKTLSYLIPLILQIHHLTSVLPKTADLPASHRGPYAVILVETHEIASQVEFVAKSLSRGIPDLRTALIIGGEPVPIQLHRLKKGCQILIGTPGRVLSILQSGKCAPLQSVFTVVVDGVDRLKRGDVQRQIKSCFDILRQRRTDMGVVEKRSVQRIFLSREADQSVDNWISGMLNGVVRVELAGEGEGFIMSNEECTKREAAKKAKRGQESKKRKMEDSGECSPLNVGITRTSVEVTKEQHDLKSPVDPLTPRNALTHIEFQDPKKRQYREEELNTDDLRLPDLSKAPKKRQKLVHSQESVGPQNESTSEVISTAGDSNLPGSLKTSKNHKTIADAMRPFAPTIGLNSKKQQNVEDVEGFIAADESKALAVDPVTTENGLFVSLTEADSVPAPLQKPPLPTPKQLTRMPSMPSMPPIPPMLPMPRIPPMPLLHKRLPTPAPTPLPSTISTQSHAPNSTPFSPKQLISILHDTKYFSPSKRAIVFVASKNTADALVKLVTEKTELRCENLFKRDAEVVKRVLENEVEVLVTGVGMARMMSFNVDLVFNFDAPSTVADYTQQVTRCDTTRGTGWAITFINASSKSIFRELATTLSNLPPGRVTPLPQQIRSYLG
ncbi:hypothetical protein BC829DRAFT_487195 [Chytridium lagenaria]|nr:hypothetical protein BC829DRAFT_487195 [Chytridium lagenaria]